MSATGEYVAVIFSSLHSGTDGEGYGAMAERMETLAAEQPGYLGIESARNPDGSGITVSYWATESDAAGWKRVSEHLAAQNAGRDRWYDSYRVRVATVTREYAWERPATLVHMALPADWSAAQGAGEYRTSTRGVTLEQEGFIHCSFDHQVVATANRFYGDLDALILLRIDPTLLAAEVVVEPPFPGAVEHFPHVYGPIALAAVIETTAWHRTGDAWL